MSDEYIYIQAQEDFREAVKNTRMEVGVSLENMAEILKEELADEELKVLVRLLTN